MDLLFWGMTISVVGKVLLGVTVIRVHSKIVHEHKVDGAVLKEMRKEKILAILGVFFMVVGYILEAMFYGYF
ncbi:hypothetical protein HQ403_02690 [Candidatus Kaiserbacteria bacterium]|nr:hypothetical protein [Candidatus Kaiserbacteria bacterium]